MAAPTRLHVAPLYRPTGNSPPVYLCQHLGREHAAKILSLGCGDVRNILFTAYCEKAHDRPLDITCCDIDKLVIARDIFILSMLIDNENDEYTEANAATWAIFANMVLTEKEFQTFRKQGKKLRQRAKSLEKWHNCAYGKVIRFCDSESLDSVCEVWEDYTKGYRSDISEFERTVSRAKMMGEAKGISKELIIASVPLIYGSLTDLDGLREKYWENGEFGDATTREKDQERYCNPTFWSLIVHPSTCPLEGFNLALAFDLYSHTSPLATIESKCITDNPYLSTAMTQFFGWSEAFRQSCREGKITLRFAVSDALAFCEALQNLSRGKMQSTSKRASRGRLTLKTVDLDSPDYTQEIKFSQKRNLPGSKHMVSEPDGALAEPGDQFPNTKKSKALMRNFEAPSRFNAIETGDLVDKCGSMNILLATAPLLDRLPSSTLVTDASFTEDPDYEGVLIGFFPGDFETIAELMGLLPIEYWCNVTSTQTASKDFFLSVQRVLGQSPEVKSRVCWKSCLANDYVLDSIQPFSGLHCTSEGLALNLFALYANMFAPHEDDETSKGTWHRKVMAPPLYHNTQATFAALLKRIKDTAFIVWDDFVKAFFDFFDEEVKSTGRGFFSELLAQLHRFDVLDLADSGRLLGEPFANATLVHATLCVPPDALFRFLWPFHLSKLQNLRVFCTVTHPGPMLMHFTVLRMTIGTILESGQIFGRRSSRLVIKEHQRGWYESRFSPLLVTFCAPSSVFADPDLWVSFHLERTDWTVEALEPMLGFDLAIFKTSLDDEMGIFVCSEAPIIHSSGECIAQRPEVVLPYHTPSSRPQNPTDRVSRASSTVGGTVASASGQDQEATSATEALQDGHDTAPACCVFKKLSSEQPRQDVLFHVKIFPIFDMERWYTQRMTATLTFPSEVWKNNFSKGAKVTSKYVSPCTVAVCMEGIRDEGFITFPVPIIQGKMMTTEYRDIATIVLSFPVGDPSKLGYLHNLMCPSGMYWGEMITFGLPRMPLDGLPIFDRSKLRGLDAMDFLLSNTYSQQERSHEDQLEDKMFRSEFFRVAFKWSMVDMLKSALGLGNRKIKTFFAVCHIAHTVEIDFVLCVSAVRFDMIDHSAVLDAAVLTVTERNKALIREMTSICLTGSNCGPAFEDHRTVTMAATELGMWRRMICAAVERARTWSHRADCEYKIMGRVPISYDPGKDFLCSCGHGKLPDNYLKVATPYWDTLKRSAVRAAISPRYASMLVEQQVRNHLAVDYSGKDSEDKCFHCAKKQDSGAKEMAKCSRCAVASYCSRECQKEGWKKHKHVCKLYSAFGNSDLWE